MPRSVHNPHLFPSRVEIDLDALSNNVRCIKRLAGDHVGVMAVVKANAYGHGAPQVARVALENGADMLAGRTWRRHCSCARQAFTRLS